jgi:hypothetical protein
MKVCLKCNQTKEITEFYKNKQAKDGLRSDCKECHYVIRKQWHEKNKEHILSKVKEYRSRKDIKYKRNQLSKEWNKKNNNSVLCTKAKKRAKELNIPFNVAKEDIQIPENCPVLGIKLEYSDNGVSDNSPSIDRIIPELGYIKENIVVISHKANRIKNNATFEEIEKLYLWFKNLENK